jgi:hypothetical protein
MVAQLLTGQPPSREFAELLRPEPLPDGTADPSSKKATNTNYQTGMPQIDLPDSRFTASALIINDGELHSAGARHPQRCMPMKFGVWCLHPELSLELGAWNLEVS